MELQRWSLAIFRAFDRAFLKFYQFTVRLEDSLCSLPRCRAHVHIDFLNSVVLNGFP
jgi:hypothetical protein